MEYIFKVIVFFWNIFINFKLLECSKFHQSINSELISDENSDELILVSRLRLSHWNSTYAKQHKESEL
jgi:hypothetical protein